MLSKRIESGAWKHHEGGISLIGDDRKMQMSMILELLKNPGVSYFCGSIHLPHDIPREMATGICR